MPSNPTTPDRGAGPSASGPAEVPRERLDATAHYEASLQRDLRRITTSIERMAALAERALREAVTALRDRNCQLGYAVIIRDQAIDALEREIARLCLEFLVRQQPVAAPLRLVYSAIKINVELERVGDYAESIAHQATKLSALDVTLPLDRFQQIADLVVSMLRDAVRAFVTQDETLARATIPTEDTVDLLKSQLRRDLVQMYRGHQLPFEALDPCLTITRRLERMSDQARNICAETLYVCTGELALHRDSDFFRVLFLDRQNAGSSLIAEAIAGALGQPGFVFSSAGLDPQPAPPAVLDYLRAKGHDPSRLHPKALTQVPQLDLYHVVVVLHPEAKKLFPRQAHKIIFLDWTVEDPAGVSGPPEAVRAACDRAYQTLEQHLRALVQAIAGETTADSRP